MIWLCVSQTAWLSLPPSFTLEQQSQSNRTHSGNAAWLYYCKILLKSPRCFTEHSCYLPHLSGNLVSLVVT